MAVITNLRNMSTEEVLDLMNNVVGDVGSVALEIAKSAVEAKAAKALASSIDQFRRSNEKASKVLIALTAVIGIATLVQAFYALILLFKR
jgi:hypothetical protein